MNWRVTAVAAVTTFVVIVTFNLLPIPWGSLIVGFTFGAGFTACYEWGRRTALVLRFHGGPRDGDVFRLPAPDIVTVPLPDGGIDESGRYVFDGFDGYWQRADV